ncbi:MAG: AMP-binding protein [Actinomycetota bacterium]
MLLRRSVLIEATPDAVFDLVSRPERYAEFMAGVTRWDARTKRTRGRGARFKILMKVGSIEAGGVVRITEWLKNRVIEWRAEQGIDQSGRWQIRPVEGGGTELSLQLEFNLVGPLSGVVERLAARVVGRNVEASLLAARRILESEAGSRPRDRDTDRGEASDRARGSDGSDGSNRSADADGSTAPPSGARSQLARSLDLMHPKVLATLRRAGVLRPAAAVAAVSAAPWYVGRGPSLGIVSQLNAVSVPAKDAIRDRSGSLSWLQVDARANRLVHVLQSQGVRPGDRVALLLRNGREFAEALIACQKVGIVAAPLNTWAKPAELAVTIEGASPRLLIYDRKHQDQVREAVAADLPKLVVGSESVHRARGEMPYEGAVAAASAIPPLPYARAKGSARVVIHTSGTTGTPKGAARDAGVMGVQEFIGLLDTVPLRRDDVFVVPAPLFHSFGLLAFSLGSLLGVTFVFPERFDPERTLALIEEHRATAAAMVPVMIHRIMSLPPSVRKRYDLSSLRVLLASGSAISQDLRAEIDRMFPETLYDLYGSTEAGWVAIATPQDMVTHPGTVGRPVWGVELAVYSADGERLGSGETGEIHVRSGALFEGYTSGEQKRYRDGFVSIGDLGHVDDDGFLYLEGRADDMVVVGGENVYPAEIEAVIGRISGVDDVAVFGAPDPEYGEVLAAFVVGSASPDHVKETARRELASFKVPRHVKVVADLPRTSTGKVLKRKLIPLLEGS